MLTFFFWRNFSFFFIPRLKIIFFFFYALAFCFFFPKRKRSLSLSFTFTLSFTLSLSLSLSDKFFGGRGKKSGGEERNRGAIKKSQQREENHRERSIFFKEFFDTKKNSKRLTYCFLNHEKIPVLKLLLQFLEPIHCRAFQQLHVFCQHKERYCTQHS